MRNYSLLLCVVLLAGCASGVSRPRAVAPSGFVCSPESPVGSVEVVLTEEGKASLKDNLKFDSRVLLDHVERALEDTALLDRDKRGGVPGLIVEVKDIRVRSNFSAVMWGFMAGDDHIVGDVVVKDPSGKELDRFEVSVSYALGGLVGGLDGPRMAWLYEAFAKELLKELTGGNGAVAATQGTAAGTQGANAVAPGASGASQAASNGYDLRVGDVVLVKFSDGMEREITVTDVAATTFNGTYRHAGANLSSRIFNFSEVTRVTLVSRAK